MSKYVSGKELLDRWQIKDFELFEYVSSGKLSPYDKFGRLLPHPYLLSNARLQELKGQLKHQKSILEKAKNYKILQDHPQRQKLEASIATKKQNARDAIAWLKAELYESEAASPESIGWKGCKLPDEKEKARQLIALVTKSIYHTEDISSVERERAQEQRKAALVETTKKCTTKKLRRSQIHKLNCRAVAARFWKADESITIASVINSQEIIDACDGKIYTEKTIRNWIKDLCPNRSRGRRPKKNQ